MRGPDPASSLGGMAIDSMNKVIHAAVRRDLRRLEAALGEVDDGDRPRAVGLDKAWSNLRHQLVHHHTQEDTILFPVAVQLGAEESLVQAMESEHQEMSRALDAIDEAMRSYVTSASAADAVDAAAVVRRGTMVVDQHLAHEEEELEPFLVRHEQTPEFQAALRRLRRQPPVTAGWFFAWLQDGADPEAQAWLDAEVPGPVRFVFGRVFGRGYHRGVAPVWSRPAT